MFKAPILAGTAIALPAVLAPMAAQAAPGPFCRDYAAAAVRQVEAARSVPACNRGTGARWTTDFKVHFDWCAGATRRLSKRNASRVPTGCGVVVATEASGLFFCDSKSTRRADRFRVS